LKTKDIFIIEGGIRAVTEIDGVERAVLRNVYGHDICESRYRIIRLLELFNNLRATIALYKSTVRKFETGCIIVVSEDRDEWNMLKSLCIEKGFEKDDECINHLVEILTQFLYDIAVFQQVD